MAFDLGGTVNATADWFCNAPLVRSVVNNPFFTALLITALVAVVIMALYHQQIKQGGLKREIRAFLYIFLSVLMVVFVHHYAVTSAARRSAAQTGVRDVFSSIEQSRIGGAPRAVPVMPSGYATGAGGYATGAGGYAETPASSRPDNLSVQSLDNDFMIEDVVVPTAGGPFGPASALAQAASPRQ